MTARHVERAAHGMCRPRSQAAVGGPVPGAPGIATTHISGTLTRLAAALVGWVRAAATPAPTSRLTPLSSALY